MNQTIKTSVGLAIIIIFGITVGAFTWYILGNDSLFQSSSPATTATAPTNKNVTPGGPAKMCPQEVFTCPDGSHVSRTGPNCEFAECPNGKSEQNYKIIKYKSDKNGVYFEYPDFVGNEKVLVSEKDNKISMFIKSDEYRLFITSLNFRKKDNEKINDAILRLFSNGNTDCIVVKKDISKGVFNEIDYDNNNTSGDYDLYGKLGLEDEEGCGAFEGGGHAHFIYNKKYPDKIIFVEYGNYSFLSGFETSGKALLDWLKSISYYK